MAIPFRSASILTSVLVLVALELLWQLRFLRLNDLYTSSSSSISDCSGVDFLYELKNDQHGICQKLPRGKSAASLWSLYSADILQASKDHEKDRNGTVHGTWMEELFQVLTSSVMERAMVSFPSTRDLESIRQIINEKWQHFDTAPPLRIAVFGGSVPQGRGCDALPKEIKSLLPDKMSAKITGNSCSWVHRLQLMADAFFGPGVVKIFNLAAGGTHSKLAIPIMEYWLYRGDLKQVGPDVIINAYATNDSLYSWSKNITVSNATRHYEHYRTVLSTARDFARAAVTSRPKCTSTDRNPIMVFVQEYIGNHHELILGEAIRPDAVRNLAQHAGWAYVSSAYAVQPWVFANTNETVFSPDWYGPKGRRIIDGHFGMPGHQTLAWVMAYASLQAMVEHCEHVHNREFLARRNTQWSNEIVSDAANAVLESPVPPPDSWNTTATTIAKEWQAEVSQQQVSDASFCKSASQSQSPCIFAFVSTQAGTHRKAGALNKYIKPFQTENSGWEAEDDMRNGWQVCFDTSILIWSHTVLLPFESISIVYLSLSLVQQKRINWDS